VSIAKTPAAKTPTAVVTGANSGIGHALAQILVKQVRVPLKLSLDQINAGTEEQQGYRVVTVDVNMGAPIIELGCETAQPDVSSQHDIEAFKERMAYRPIDILLNVAGIMYPQDSDTLEKVNLMRLQKTFAVNTSGPLLLTQALLPSIELADRPLIAVMSPRVGSIGDNSTGSMYSYRSSKLRRTCYSTTSAST
jgi:NAD(P)-dependent dehydrogenase (short-subunit alcohol dehydrogenase family)